MSTVNAMQGVVKASEEEKNWSKQNLSKLRRILDKTDEKELKESLIKYTETVELLTIRYPAMGFAEKVDWSMAMALSPEWYGDGLNNRLQNAMLVSALLLTVTSTIFISPPLSDNTSNTYRCLIYVTGICNMLFIMSIMLGVFYIENAMSRAYGQSERFVLIIKYYSYKNLSQIFMSIGSALFPIILAIPMWEQYMNVDAGLLYVFTVAYVLATMFIMVQTTIGAKVEQDRRLAMFCTLLDPKTCHLLPEYYPPDADMQPEDFREMYAM
jgi:hypothetical protein